MAVRGGVQLAEFPPRPRKKKCPPPPGAVFSWFSLAGSPAGSFFPAAPASAGPQAPSSFPARGVLRLDLCRSFRLSAPLTRSYASVETSKRRERHGLA